MKKYPSDLFITSVLSVPEFAAGVTPETIIVMAQRIKELEAENARLRQQRDAANAQLDFILENKQV